MDLKKNRFDYIWLVLGVFAFIFTRTGWYIPLAIFVSSIFFLRFLRKQKALKGILLTLAGMTISMLISSWGIDKDNVLLSVIFMVVTCIIKTFVLALPFIADRLLYRKGNTSLDTLVFPISATALYFIVSKWSQIYEGVAYYFSYTQFGNMSLVQLLSIFGIWGSIFFISWFASIVNYLWENNFDLIQTKKKISAFLITALIIFIYGGIKSSPLLYNYENETVKVAAITIPIDENKKNPNLLEIYENREFSDIDNKLIVIREKIKKAVHANAEIIAFMECSLIIPEEKKNYLIESLRAMAIENNIFLCINYVWFPELMEGEREYSLGMMELSDEEEGRNISLLINNKGDVLIEYMKHNLVIGEDNYILNGPSKINVVNSPYGRISVVTCRDMEFSDYMNKAAQKKADIVIAPSYEAYKALSITYMQMLRAVENGFSFIRSCGNGLSVAIDYHGNILAQQNYFTSKDGIMLADVPTKRIPTLYSIIGDSLAWLCIGALLYIIMFAIIKKKKG